MDPFLDSTSVSADPLPTNPTRAQLDKDVYSLQSLDLAQAPQIFDMFFNEEKMICGVRLFEVGQVALTTATSW